MKTIKKNLVLSGGGVKGIAHIGALYALKELGILNNIEIYAGTSIGSLIISLLVIGYNPSEIYDFIKLFNFNKLKDIDIMNIQYFGLDTGAKFEYVIKRLIKGKNLDENISLDELYKKTNKKLIFTTVCINTMKLCYLSYDTHGELPLYLAIRMSSSLPFIYTPVKYKNYLYIDGGCFDNFPVNLFDKTETIGLNLLTSIDIIENIDNLESYMFRIMQCIMYGISYNCKKGYDENTIDIHLESINIVNFNIDDEKKDELFLNGYKSVYDNLNKLFINS